MKIDWILIGWIIDMVLNGIAWLVIVAIAIPLIDKTDKWTRKSVKLMGKVDDWARELLEKNYFQVPYSLLPFFLSPNGPAIKIVIGLMPGSKSTRCKLSALLKPI